jgi:hydroxymethylpyrimidine pyrophosphatase-like HAD family hydrolase
MTSALSSSGAERRAPGPFALDVSAKPQAATGAKPQAMGTSAELAFYEGYPWCLNPYPTVRDTISYLGLELDRLGKTRESWQTCEVMTNVFLLSCALVNSVDDFLRGKDVTLPRKAPRVPLSRLVLAAGNKLLRLLRIRRRTHVRRWRECWQGGFDRFLSLFVASEAPEASLLADTASRLAESLRLPLPADLLAEHTYFPSAFRKHDLTHFDVLSLGRLFASRFSDRGQPLLLVGLRTAGSYFGPLLRAFLKAEGYEAVDAVTVRPDRGASSSERAELIRCAQIGALAVILDDAPGTGDTIALAADLVRKSGFAKDRIIALAPVHPASRDWQRHLKSLPLIGTTVIELQLEEWHKWRILDSAEAEGRVADFFHTHGYSDVRLVASKAVEEFNARLEQGSVDDRRSRLKRIWEVQLQTAQGEMETRHVLAKSVGWGWLGYHAFLAGHRLAGLVPPVLGLRDGILYTEWLPQSPHRTEDDREERRETIAVYAAARACSLRLGTNPLPSLGLHQHHDGFGLFDRVLSRAYGGRLTAGLMRRRVRSRLASLPCPVPTLIDGKMQASEWITGPAGLLKTDFEHHGMGKNELNLVDPAYDLAETILDLNLSPEEECRLLNRYREESGDHDVEQRLFLNKVFAGTWAMATALKHLFRHPQLTHRQEEFHHDFVAAWHFLTVQTARFCGRYCRPAAAPRWRSPLVVTDIDGVLDRRFFGFPCTTLAGIEAFALLHAHEVAIAVDTARCLPEVQEYCQAYGFVGGVAEYGSYAWDAVRQAGRVLVSAESLGQIDTLRQALRRLPGVFLDDRYRYSIRACTYEDKSPPVGRVQMPYALSSIRSFTSEDKSPAPLPTLVVQQLLAELKLDRLIFQQTTIDTAVVAKEVDKGTGLVALLELAGQDGGDTTAVGDSEPDLPMFRVAKRSFAPGGIGCASQARLLGCKVVSHRYQRGLLEAARRVVHPDGGRCPRCRRQEPSSASASESFFLDLLRAADRTRSAALLRTLLDPKTYQVFLR